jgi:hypothetical protein
LVRSRSRSLLHGERATRAVLAVLVLCFVAFAWLYVPRLVNCLWSDDEFTGWVAPIAQRIAAGERIYRDFTLPIPPGSFLLVAAVQAAVGRAMLLDELWLVAACHLGMVLAAYWMVRPLCGPRTAVLTAMCTAPVITATPKEIAYDQTAQLIGWVSIALLVVGLCAKPGRARLGWLAAAGLASAVTIAFKSSTGLGAVGGALAAMGLIAVLSYRSEGWSALRARWTDGGALVGGMVAGIVATILLVLGAGGRLSEFYQAVFVDGPALKGGTARAVGNLLSYSAFQYPVHLSLLVGLVVAYVLARVVGQRTGLLVPSGRPGHWPTDHPATGTRFFVACTLLLVATYGMGVALLNANVEYVPLSLRALAELGRHPRMLSLLFLVIVFVANLRGAKRAMDRRSIFAAIVVAASLQSMLHSLSTPQTRLFYYNNPVIPLAIASSLWVLYRARAHVLRWVFVLVFLTGLFGGKFQRYLDARFPAADDGFWRGLKVSKNGNIVLLAAKRARELAGPNGTVLTLPEDPAFAALIGKPRPKLFGAILFVDQYPEHALTKDEALLDAELPNVVVIHPRATHEWKNFNAIWSRTSPAEQLHDRFVAKHLGSRYRLDSSYPTWFFHTTSALDVYVRNP